MSAAHKIMQRLDALAQITDEPGVITRVFASDGMCRANDLVGGWMRQAGMKTRVDAAGNLIGQLDSKRDRARTLLLGSHLDTVRNAGKFDGPLGVILAIACVEELSRREIELPFALDIIGFSDEEGVRYHTTYLGSKAVAGCFNLRDLQRTDADGISMADALRKFGCHPDAIKAARLDPKKLIGYVEAHIEQGPILEKEDLAVGIVTAIAGQSRARVMFIGHAGHAGTVPMNFREDALCAAAEFVLAAEKLARKTPGLLATVGQIAAQPGASNVIPGEARLSLDVRHSKDKVRRAALKELKRTAQEIVWRRGLKLRWENAHDAVAVICSKDLSQQLALAVRHRQKAVPQLPSGAGHDAVVMSKITPVAMLFVRCKGGISHHPKESVKAADLAVALEVMTDFILRLARSHEQV